MMIMSSLKKIKQFNLCSVNDLVCERKFVNLIGLFIPCSGDENLFLIKEAIF